MKILPTHSGGMAVNMMNILATTAQAVMKRPFILILIGALMLAAAIANVFIPVMAVIIGIVKVTGGGIFDSVLSILQMLIDPGVLSTLLIFLAALTLLTSIIAGLLLPGYLLIVGNGVTKGNKRPGLFTEGLKSNFFRFFIMTVKTVLCTVLLAIFLMVASVPAIIITKAAFTTKPDLMIGALFVDFVTVGVLFMCLSFFRAYVYMWYVAASKGEKKPFVTGKAIADRQFWGMTLRLLVFDVIFVAVLFAIYLSSSQFFRYTAGLVFTTVFFTALAVYLVDTYENYSGKVSRQER